MKKRIKKIVYIHKIFDGKSLTIITTKDKDLKIKSYGGRK